ncbi:MAG: hypothetical protein Q7R76_07100 [Candidatus Woesearchaeota archaeon]|nr:hypothetical protein [Candidatus Woesearchaeota archaeon]
MTDTINVGVIGHTGRLGKPLVEMLERHPHFKIAYTESRTEGTSGNKKDAELVFLALPKGESESYLRDLRGKRLIDLSVDHRAAEGWTYGLPELNADEIAAAKLVANPGCYATSVILGLAPLKGKVMHVQVASTSGISGAGLPVKETDNFLTYDEGMVHGHIPEMERALGLEDMLFVPQRIDVAERGIVSTIFAFYSHGTRADVENVREVYESFYATAPFVRVTDSIETRKVNGTNYCDIKVLGCGENVVVVSAIDNLIKGGAGQAIQNANIMYGFRQATGLPTALH